MSVPKNLAAVARADCKPFVKKGFAFFDSLKAPPVEGPFRIIIYFFAVSFFCSQFFPSTNLDTMYAAT